MARTQRGIVRRAKEVSKQPRFKVGSASDFYFSTLQWVTSIEQAPKYDPDTRNRDTWLASFWHSEPHLAGVLHSLISIDSNRGWSLTGGRNQVIRYTDILHSWTGATSLKGWRSGCAMAALSFYTTDLGAVIEVGRDGKNGPARRFYHVDPTICKINGTLDTPLSYAPEGTVEQKWREKDFMRIVSMPSIYEKYKGVGYSFESRALEMAQMMVAVYQHDNEQLGAKAPKGLLLLKGISEDQWDDAMEARKIKSESLERQYFENVAVLASMGGEENDAKLIALSSLPANFDHQQFTSMLMYAYALCAGYDPSEFYPVQFGSLGRGTEMEVQHQKATGKGGMNFIISLQEQIQREDVLPPSLEFDVEQRDDQGELLEAGVQKAWAEVVKTIRESGAAAGGDGVINNQQARYLLAERNLIPLEWTEDQAEAELEDTETGASLEENTDEDNPLAFLDQPAKAKDELELLLNRSTRSQRAARQLRDALLAKPSIWRAANLYKDEPIIRYRWPLNRMITLWHSGEDLLKRRLQTVARTTVLFSGDDFQITDEDVTQAEEEGKQRVGIEFEQLLNNEPISGYPRG